MQSVNAGLLGIPRSAQDSSNQYFNPILIVENNSLLNFWVI
jgi:hypothetical protein